MTTINQTSDVRGHYFPLHSESSQKKLAADEILSGFNGISGIPEDKDSQQGRQLRELTAKSNTEILQALEQNGNRASITIASGVTLTELANDNQGTDIEVSVGRNPGSLESENSLAIQSNMSLANLKDRLEFDQFAHPDIYKVERQLIHRDWSDVDLNHMSLQQANLQEANLQEANLREANLERANLQKAKLGKADLSYANLSEAKLCDTILVKASLYTADLSKADLSHANLSKADLGHANLSHANLSHANLSDADLLSAKLNGAILDNANLDEADLSNANLSNANLSNATMKSVSLEKATLTDASLNGTAITLRFPRNWEPQTVDQYFNHNTDDDGRSLLMTIESIQDCYEEIKINLMRQICAELQAKGVDLGFVRENFLLLTKPMYSDSAKIAQFCKDHIINPLINQANEHPWLNQESTVCNALLTHVKSNEAFNPIENNGFFIQLILNSLDSGHTETAENAQQYYEKTYLSNGMDIMKKVTTYDFFGLNSESPRSNSSSNSVNSESPKSNSSSNRIDWSNIEDINFVLIDDGVAMLISQKQLTAMRQGDAQQESTPTSWDRYFLLQMTNEGELTPYPDPSNIGDFNIGDFFAERFKIFHEPYLSCSMKEQFFSLLRSLELGDPYFDIFVNASNTAKAFQKKLTEFEHQEALDNLFEKTFNTDKDGGRPDDISLTEAHYQNILDIYGLTGANTEKQAGYLLCLAAVFVKYSSSSILGTEDDSPLAVRHYAYALMRKAEELSPGVCDGEFEDWKARLLGLDDAFTCTYVLFNSMRQNKQQHVQRLMGMVLPSAWR